MVEKKTPTKTRKTGAAPVTTIGVLATLALAGFGAASYTIASNPEFEGNNDGILANIFGNKGGNTDNTPSTTPTTAPTKPGQPTTPPGTTHTDTPEETNPGTHPGSEDDNTSPEHHGAYGEHGDTPGGTVGRHGDTIGNPETDSAGNGIYHIKPGDTLAGVSDQVGTSVDSLVKNNDIIDPNLIYEGSTVKVPAPQPWQE